MISIDPCIFNLPVCNTKMLIDDYSTAIYWRIAAIFATISALFSAAVVLWFLMFRENPNMPDETDSQEKLRFHTNVDKDKHNLLSEIVATFYHMPSFNASNFKKIKNKSQNFFQRLAYFLFGSIDDDCSLSDIENNTVNKHNRKSNKNLNNSNKKKDPKKKLKQSTPKFNENQSFNNSNTSFSSSKEENSLINLENNDMIIDETKPKKDTCVAAPSLLNNKQYKVFKKATKFVENNVSKNNNLKIETSRLNLLNSEHENFLNAKNMSESSSSEFEFSSFNSTQRPATTKNFLNNIKNKFFKTLSTNNNNNTNGRRLCHSDTYLHIKKADDSRKYTKSLEKFQESKFPNLNKNLLEIDDNLLNELNKNFEYLIRKNSVDACISIYYFEKLNLILLMFHSLINLTDECFQDVNVIVDVFNKDKCKKRYYSKMSPIKIEANKEILFKQSFIIKLNKMINVKSVILNVYIIGKNYENSENCSLKHSSQNLLLFSKSSLSNRHILGGAHVIIKKFL